MLATTKTFELGNTIYFECLYRDLVGSPTDPATPAWAITNIKGAVDSGTPTKRTTGIWYCFWIPDEVGDYILTFTGNIDNYPVVMRRPFKVVETRIK